MDTHTRGTAVQHRSGSLTLVPPPRKKSKQPKIIEPTSDAKEKITHTINITTSIANNIVATEIEPEKKRTGKHKKGTKKHKMQTKATIDKDDTNQAQNIKEGWNVILPLILLAANIGVNGIYN